MSADRRTMLERARVTRKRVDESERVHISRARGLMFDLCVYLSEFFARRAYVLVRSLEWADGLPTDSELMMAARVTSRGIRR